MRPQASGIFKLVEFRTGNCVDPFPLTQGKVIEFVNKGDLMRAT